MSIDIIKGSFQLDPGNPDGEVTELEKLCLDKYNSKWYVASTTDQDPTFGA